MRKQNNNKGFSLVELIVVVLIMGIIAVSLAPQVMKWVGKAKESTDFSNLDYIKSVTQIAVAAYESSGTDVVAENYNICSTGVVASDGTDENTNLSSLIEEFMGQEYPKVQSEKDKVFQIQIQNGATKIDVVYAIGTY